MISVLHPCDLDHHPNSINSYPMQMPCANFAGSAVAAEEKVQNGSKYPEGIKLGSPVQKGVDIVQSIIAETRRGVQEALSRSVESV